MAPSPGGSLLGPGRARRRPADLRCRLHGRSLGRDCDQPVRRHLPILAFSAAPAALAAGQVDATLDTTQGSPVDVGIHPAEKTVVENLLRAGATVSLKRHGRLLFLHGDKGARLPKNLLGLLDGTRATAASVQRLKKRPGLYWITGP